jgi:hypothetical protein
VRQSRVWANAVPNRNRIARSPRSRRLFETAEFDGDDPLAFVISKNLKRRHLSVDQRAVVAAKIANMPLGGAFYRSANLQTDVDYDDEPVITDDEIDRMAEAHGGNQQASFIPDPTDDEIRFVSLMSMIAETGPHIFAE